MNKLSSLVSFLLLFGSITSYSQNSTVDILLQNIAAEEGLGANDINDYVINNTHRSRRSNLNHFYLRQRYDGIEIYKTQSSIHTLIDNSIFRYNSAFLKDIAQKVTETRPTLSHTEAIQKVIENFGYDDSQMPVELENSNSRDQAKLFSKGSISLEDIPVKLMYYLTESDELHLCYDMSISETDFSDWWSLKVDATTGEIVDQINWTVECNFEHDTKGNHVCKDNHTCAQMEKVTSRSAGAAMTSSYNVYAVPVESPNHGSRSIVNNPEDLTASPFGWHDTNGVAGAESTLSIGNNVLAQEDENGNNGTGFRPDGGTALNFDFGIDFTMAPTNSRDASLTNLFYWNNVTHDIWYQYGFDEGAGNFQENNYGNGGFGSDRVNADGLDGSGLNNANFSTPPDGNNPRMQMFLWSPGVTTSVVINTPSAISGNILGLTANFGPTNYNITADIVEVDDGTASPTLGCNALINGSSVNGNIALIDRGTCQFGTKVLNAEDEGAIAAIVCQNSPAAPFEMGAGAVGNQVTIPSIMISQADCNTIKTNLPGVNINLVGVDNNVNIDGSFDNLIIGHEYGHGISIRLTGGAGNSGCLGNQEQMGEGWSDWIGLMMTMDANDVSTQVRGVGTYATSESIIGGGIRDFPYSTDLGIDPRTYDDIKTASIPHGIGSIWCAMLWEMTWGLIDEHGFDPDFYNGTGGNNIAMELVTEALKLQPCSPGFVDGRDAIIDADIALNGGANECIIWEAFAKRGLGVNATQGSTNSRSDGTENFEIPAACETLDITKTVDKTSVIIGDTLTYTLTYDNNTSVTYTNVDLIDTLASCLNYITGSATNNASFSNGVVSLTGLNVAPFTTVSFSFQVEVDPSLTSINQDYFEDVENGTGDWVLENSSSIENGFVIDNANPFQGTYSWFAENTNVSNNKFLVQKLPNKITANSELKFWHLYDIATTEGAVVEISSDNQATWEDLDPYFTQNGYNFTLGSGSNAKSVFSGLGNTTYIESIVNLSSFAGQNVFIRFNITHSGSPNGTGWRIDDIEITNTEKTITNIGNFTASPGVDETISIYPPTEIILGTCTDGIQNGAETGIDTGGNCSSGGPCDFDLTLSGDPAAGGTYEAQNQITSTATIDATTDYFASCILLENDFEVVAGTQFLAEINPCTPFDDDGELELKVVSTSTQGKQKNTVIDVNIPEKGEYTLQLRQEDGKNLILPTQNFEKGVHRITVETAVDFTPSKIEMVKK